MYRTLAQVETAIQPIRAAATVSYVIAPYHVVSRRGPFEHDRCQCSVITIKVRPAADENILVVGSYNAIVASTTNDQVATLIAKQSIVIGTADQDVVATSTLQNIVAITAVQRVITIHAIQTINSRATDQEISQIVAD